MKNYKKSFGDRVFDLAIYLFILFVLVVTLYPLIYIFSMSISSPIAAARGDVVLLPKGFDLTALNRVLADKQIFTYYFNTLWFTVVGTVGGIITTSLAAYPLSRPEFEGRNVIMKFIMVTMFFNGGLIPTYIVIAKYLNLYNTRWAIILPALSSAWYVTVARSFFSSLPGEIIESARIDGASEYRIFGQLVIPLSKPIVAVLALYYSVFFWNSYFPAMLYLGKKELQPLALYVRSVVIQNNLTGIDMGSVELSAEQILASIQIKYAVILVAVLPMLCIYPFLSKNLEKGLMIGAVKG